MEPFAHTSVFHKDRKKMNSPNPKKKILSIILSASMLVGSIAPFSSAYAITVTEIKEEKPDSVKVEIQDKKNTISAIANDRSKKVKTSSKLSYNIIYYLISKFIEANPLSRPQ